MKTLRIISVSLLIFVGINAIVAGFLFMYDPSGSMMGMKQDYLQYSPFNNYLIPGLVLFLVQGVLSIWSAMWCIKRKSFYPLMIMAQGILLGGWILIQVMMVHDFNALHSAMLTIGATLLICGIVLKRRIRHEHQ